MRRMKAAESRIVISEPSDAANRARPVMRDLQETFVAIYLDVRNQMLGTPYVVAIGTVCGVEVHPREVFREGIARAAAGVVVLHNHPSGDPTPSPEDLALTKRLQACGDLIGMPVVDHVVVTASSYQSIAEYLPQSSRYAA